MEQILEALTDWLQDNWIKFLTGLFIMAVGWFFGQRRARVSWKEKEFLDRLNVSLNSIDGGTLLIRTILEKSCKDVFLNDVAVAAIRDASENTSEDAPTLPLPESEYWYYLNSVLNEVAEQFSEGQIRRDMGLPVTVKRYLICLTSECAGELKTRKVRAMLIQATLLDALPEEQPNLESPHHITRWDTLQKLAKLRKSSPYRFLEIEICI
jgi:hypothetical protein